MVKTYHPSIHPFTHPSIHSSIRPSVCLFVCLSVRLSVCPSLSFFLFLTSSTTRLKFSNKNNFNTHDDCISTLSKYYPRTKYSDLLSMIVLKVQSIVSFYYMSFRKLEMLATERISELLLSLKNVVHQVRYL